MKQTVNQSRSNTTLVHRGTPSHAVDGIILIDSSKMVCAWIGDGSEPPKWYLKFNRPHILHRVIIYTNTGKISFFLTTYQAESTDIQLKSVIYISTHTAEFVLRPLTDL